MEIHSLQPMLREYPFFQGMDERLLEILVGCATNLRYDEGQYVFRQNQPATHMFFLRQGEIVLELEADDRSVVAIETLNAGDVFGWSWMFGLNNWKFDARATSLTRVIAMDAECISVRCEESAELGYELMRRIAQVAVDRLQATREILIQHHFGPVASSLAP